MKKLLLTVLAAAALGGCSIFDIDSPAVTLTSPDGRNEIRLWTRPLAVAVSRDGVELVAKSEIDLEIDGRDVSDVAGAKKPAVTRRSETGAEPSPVYKKATLDLTGEFAKVAFGDCGVELAARNDGVAYRFYSAKGGEIVVNGEKTELKLPPAARCWYNETGSFGCEETVPQAADDFASLSSGTNKFIYLPFVAVTQGKTVAIMESDVFDYPILNFTKEARQGDDGDALEAKFAGFPKKTHRAGDWSRKVVWDRPGRWVVVDEHADFLVKTAGSRAFPWRVFALVDEPSKLADADIVNALARPAAKGRDFSWVRPGKVAWEWWNDFDHKGVKDGCTTATYKRFIDFAAKTGVEYVIMDEGWSENLNIWKFNPKVDVPEVIRYGKEKGVGIILWMAWGQIVGDEEKVASHFAKLGAKGFKVDFMDRGDAGAERFLWAFAEACAKNKMLVDYHGAHRPTGMSRAYPNVLGYEGIHGLECMKWFKSGQYDFMANDVRACFLRMTAGPIDYTPGAMDNYPIGRYKGSFTHPGSEGTRCRQMAMMVVYEAPLQMLSDSPTKYEKNMECFSFMSKVPTTWADTVGLGGCPDTMFAVARRAKDGAWYAAAMTNKDARDFTLDTSFLGAGEWTMEIFRDAADADTAPTHYVHETKTVNAGERIALRFAPGGGFVARFVRQAPAVADVVDPRVRTFVSPVRVVWTSGTGAASGVTNVEHLLLAKHGQVPEKVWTRGTGCFLENRGEPAGVLLDFGRELHGGLQIGNSDLKKTMRVRVRFGESVGEAMGDVGVKGSTNDHAMRDAVYELPIIGGLEVGNTGFRFVRIDLVTKGRIELDYVRAISLMRPMARVGAFRSSDARLNRVWETAVRTVHLCCQDHLWDGIKRDRLVWMGDTHPETRAILAAFGAASVLPETLDYAAAITPPETKWMNGMPNYTLWYLRNVHDWYFYTGDADFVKTRRDYLKKTVEHVLANAFGEKAVYHVKGFLDWPTQHNAPAVAAGTRGLLATTLDDAATLMDVAGEASVATRCREAAAKVRTEKPDPRGAKSAAALLALGGLRDAREMYDDVLGKGGHAGVSTFYGYYMLEAMSAAGENQRALDTVRDYWGAMLDMGATSFWEDFSIAWTNNATRIDEMPAAGKKDVHGDYGEFCYKGYRHSLCHGWSAGPAAWCINRVLGVEIVAPGGRTVRVKPFLGDLDWAEGTLPTALGPVHVRHEKRADGTISTTVDAPPGVTVER